MSRRVKLYSDASQQEILFLAAVATARQQGGIPWRSIRIRYGAAKQFRMRIYQLRNKLADALRDPAQKEIAQSWLRDAVHWSIDINWVDQLLLRLVDIDYDDIAGQMMARVEADFHPQIIAAQSAVTPPEDRDAARALLVQAMAVQQGDTNDAEQE